MDQAVEANSTDADFQAIGATILGIAYDHWRKIAMVVWKTTEALKLTYPGLSDILYAERLHLALKPTAAPSLPDNMNPARPIMFILE